MVNLEAVCVRIPIKSNFLYVYCLYIQCKGSLELYTAHLAAIKSLTSTINAADTLVILGDFNLSSAVTWESNDMGFDFIPSVQNSKPKTTIAKEVTSTLMDHSLFQMTDIKNAFNNTLDLVYTNSPELVVVNNADFLLLPTEKSDKAHVPIMCTIECCPDVLPVGDSNSVFCFKKANYEQIREHLLDIDIMNIFNNSNED